MSVRSRQTDLMRTGLYGVLGSGIAYSQSPLIFRRVFTDLGWPAVYALIDLKSAASGRLGRFLRAAPDARFVGLNVTKPYKEAVGEYCARLDLSAVATGAVNTIAVGHRGLIGYNTDVDGIMATLGPYARALKKRGAVILGVGGAARAVAWTLIEHFGISHLTLIARSPVRAERLLQDLVSHTKQGFTASILRWNDRAAGAAVGDAGLLVNATPLGGGLLKSRTPLPIKISLPSSLIVFDLTYSPRDTLLLRRARRARCRAVLGGWRMLVAQAEASFTVWTGRKFPASTRRELLQGTNPR